MEKAPKKKKSGFARFIKAIFSIILALVVILAAAFLVLTLMEYKPADRESVAVPEGGSAVEAGKKLTILTFNTGYAALGENADFFMDGGKSTRPENVDEVNVNLEGISTTIIALDPDIVMLQEADTDSTRSFSVDQVEYYESKLGMGRMFALNYSAPFVPFPIPNMLGKVHSGIATFTDHKVSSAERVQLPTPFSWPVRCFNLKRCLLVTRMPIAGSDKELVIVNLHLEAYDDGSGKIAQTKMLYDLLRTESEKGNYVIAGGDFNQTFPGAYQYPILKEGNWTTGVLDENLPEGFSFVIGGDEPTCRLLDQPYKGNENPQYYIIDGFIVSSNVHVERVETVDTAFVNSDHRPVLMEFILDVDDAELGS